MSRPLLVVEDLATVRHVRLGTVWGVVVAVTPVAWLGPIVWFLLGVGLALAPVAVDSIAGGAPDSGLSLGGTWRSALIFAVAVEVATAVHAAGHVLSGKVVGSAMDELLITMLRDINIYHGDQSGFPPRVHIGRALGGPVANLLAAATAVVLTQTIAAGGAHDLVLQIALVNSYFGFGGFLPIPSVDGEVIWREIGRLATLHEVEPR